MRTIYLSGLLVLVLVCLPLFSQNAQTSVETGAQGTADQSTSHSGPSANFVNAVTESARKNPEAARIIGQAIDALDREDLVSAEERFQRVLTIDPKFFGIHVFLGSVYLEQGKVEQALAELRKEEEYHPGSAAVYETTSELLLESGHNQEALASLRRWVAAEPTNLDAALKLGFLLSNTKNYAEAVQVLEHALPLNSESPKLQAALADAYFRNGQPGQGQAMLKKGLPASASPEDLGGAAYILADNNVELDLATKYAQRALFQLEAESAATRDEAIGIANTLRLGYVWEVMGWISYRRADYRAAVRSLEAAWLLSQRPEAGDHLGQVYEKLGRKEEAAHTYLLAVAAANGQAEDAKNRYRALTGKKVGDIYSLPSRRSTGAGAAAAASPAEELSRLRRSMSRSRRMPRQMQYSASFFHSICHPR